jgi:hypothetical protein
MRERYMVEHDVLGLGVTREWEKFVEMATRQQPGARVFRVHGKDGDA